MKFTKTLEQIARKMFSDFAMRRSGHYLDWRFLSAERKLAWVKEVEDTYQECLNNLKEDLSIGKLPVPGVGSYERGFVAGQAHEAHRLNERILIMEQMLKDQLNEFIEGNQNVD